MTKARHIRRIPVEELSGLADVLGEVEAGASFVVTRDGRDIAALSPVDAGTVAREGEAAYRTAPGREAPQPPTALLRLIGTGAARSVLALFLKSPDMRAHQREIARRANLQLRSAQLALQRLESLGLVGSARDGNRKYYHSIRSSRFEGLRVLLGPEVGIAEVLARALEPHAERIHQAFIFGSSATGEDTVSSDVDLLVVGDLAADELASALAEAQRELGREIDLISYRPQEFDRRRDAGNHFLSTILAGPRVDIIGHGDES